LSPLDDRLPISDGAHNVELRLEQVGDDATELRVVVSEQYANTGQVVVPEKGGLQAEWRRQIAAQGLCQIFMLIPPQHTLVMPSASWQK
jgi:hypothetical protein